MAITNKPQTRVQVDYLEDELPYQTNKTPIFLPIARIEQLQGLADTSILEILNDDHIELVIDDTDEDLDLSDEDDEQNDNNDEDDPD